MKATLKYMLLMVSASVYISALHAQDTDLLKLVEDKPKKEYVDYSFKSSRVIMSQSMEMIRPGTLDFRILHRFGNVNKGAYEFFGLDNATMRMGFDFGITRYLMLGVGRSTNKKEFDGFIKVRPVQQARGPGALPFSVLAVAGGTLQTVKWSDTSRKNYFTSRLAFYGQLIVGRKFSEGFSFQVMPTVLHRNLVATESDPNDMYAVGVGSRIKLSKRVSFNIDYYYRINPGKIEETFNPFSIGFDIETGGHVFQLHFTNAIGMNEKIFLTETTNSWGRGDVQFGFNLSRTFQLKKKKL
jgi:opacity protein-like surface antigen